MHTNGGCHCIREGLDIVRHTDDYNITDQARRELEGLLYTLWQRVEKAESNLKCCECGQPGVTICEGCIPF